MSNNKQSMRLYTEEQIFKYLLEHGTIDLDSFILDIKPIELPSEEEIERELESHTHMTLELGSGFIAGANYIINKIQGGNK